MRPSQLYRTALSKGIDSGRLHSRIADLLLRRGEKDAAIVEYEKAAQINPADLDSQNNLATAYLEKGRLADAERVFKWILANDADYPAAQNGMGLVSIQKQDPTPRAATSSGPRSSIPSLVEVHMNLGLIYEMAGETDARARQLRDISGQSLSRAVRRYHSARSKGTGRVQVSPVESKLNVMACDRVLLAIAQGFALQAQDALQPGSRARPSKRKRAARCNTRDYQLAVQRFEEASWRHVRRQRARCGPWPWPARISWRSESRMRWPRRKRFSGISPDEAAALKIKGNAAYLLGDLERAKDTFIRLLDRHPADEEGAYMLGRIYYQEGYIDLAIGQFERVRKINPGPIRRLTISVSVTRRRGMTKRPSATFSRRSGWWRRIIPNTSGPTPTSRICF